MTSSVLIVASNNAHKLTELQAILDASGVQVRSLKQLGLSLDPPETGDTFQANALQKARYVQARTGGWVLADDSGLEVDALGGAPGVRSRRFSPQATDAANNQLLLERLADVTDRRARFRCCIAVVGPGHEATCEGRCEGTIATAARGDGGFGYDPLFLPDATPGRTMAQLSPAEKAAIGHRGRALAQLPSVLPTLG